MILEGKNALITGASRGIGRATALAFASEGATLLLHYGRSREQATALELGITKKGGKAQIIQAELETIEGIKNLASQVRKLSPNGLDILVLNAGVSKAGPMDSHTLKDFDMLFNTNVRAPFFLMQQLLPDLRAGSSVVVTTSLAAKYSPGESGAVGAPSLPAYAATKGALETLVRHWAAQVGVRGIRVNAVSPGVIATEMSNFTKTEAGRAVALNMQALKRVGQAEDVADVIVFMSSEKARWITGASIPVDGGSKL